MRAWAGFAGILGLTLLIFGSSVALGIVLFGVFAELSVEFALRWFITAHITLGIVLLALWFFSSGLPRIRSAGNVFRGRAARFGVNAASYTLVFFGLLAAINLAAKRYD